MCNLWCLKNDFIIKILKFEGFGFVNGEESIIGWIIIDVYDVCDCLFYILFYFKLF